MPKITISNVDYDDESLSVDRVAKIDAESPLLPKKSFAEFGM